MKKKTWKELFLLFLCFLLAFLFMHELQWGPFGRKMQWYRSWIKLQTLDLFVPREVQKVLILAPHPDDEIISSAGLIFDLLAQDAEVYVVFITNGEGFGDYIQAQEQDKNRSENNRILLGYERQRESVQALTYLGLPKENIFFLAYPDGGIHKLWFSYYTIPFKSPHTRKDYSPYDNSFTHGALNTGEQLSTDLMQILQSLKPHIIITPSVYDFHPDHWASSVFLYTELEILREYGESWVDTVAIYEYLVHQGKLAWPRPWGVHQELRLIPPSSLLLDTLSWEEYPLSPEAYQAKSKALSAFSSQTPLIGQFLLAFLRKNELFCRRDHLSREIVDPKGDFVAKEIFRNADFYFKQLSYDSDYLYAKVKLAPNVGLPGVKYQVKVVLYQMLEDHRIHEERIQMVLNKENTSFYGQEFEFKVELPKDLPVFMAAISFESFTKPLTVFIDKTPWSLIRFNESLP
jgi:LmbE family N-acetylglucosaminyl deacetylase